MNSQQQQEQVSTARPVARLFIAALTSVVILTIGLVTIVVVSVIPHFGIIGWVATGVVIVCLVCAAICVVAFTFSRIGLWGNERHILRAGDIVVYLGNDGQLTHLSAMHERAKIPTIVQAALPSSRSLEEEEEEDLPMAPEDIVDLWKHGQSDRNIAEQVGMTRYQVQKVINKYKAQEDTVKPEKKSSGKGK